MSYILLNIFYTICTSSFERNCVHQTMVKLFRYFEKKVEINVNGVEWTSIQSEPQHFALQDLAKFEDVFSQTRNKICEQLVKSRFTV